MKYPIKINIEKTIKERLEIQQLGAELMQKLIVDLGKIELETVEFISVDDWMKNHNLSNDAINDFIEDLESSLESWTFRTVYYENCEISENNFQINDETWFLIKKGKTQIFAVSHDYHDILDLKIKKIKE